MFLELAQWMFEAVKDVISASRRHYLWRQCFQPVFWQFNDKPEGVGGSADQKNTEPKKLSRNIHSSPPPPAQNGWQNTEELLRRRVDRPEATVATFACGDGASSRSSARRPNGGDAY